MKLIKITTLSKELDISSRSLRYYEQVGLIKSTRLQLEKYRYYDSENIERIKQIKVLRKMQIPVKDIVRIYDSKDMSTVVEVFVNRINKIDSEINALSELKLIVYEFLNTMQEKGIKKISAIPLLYHEMEKELEQYDQHKNITYSQLNTVTGALSKHVDVSIITLPTMRMITSINKDTKKSDTKEFWNWINSNHMELNIQGQQMMFEYQNENSETVIIMKIKDDFNNKSLYSDYMFNGGLFAVGSVYTDDDLIQYHQNMLDSFDENPFYEVDYKHDGSLRHESLVETVISPDSNREKVLIYIPVKKRMPNSALYNPNETIDKISINEIVKDNPILWEENVPMDGMTPLNNPYYKITEKGDAEYISYISTRLLSTNVEVKLPFRVDIEFKVDSNSGRFGYGADEGSIIFYHGDNLYGINMHNNADSKLSEEAISFNQPIFNDYFKYVKRGKINYDVYNKLTWIIGENHFAVIINGEVRYCGINFPYMTTDLSVEKSLPIILGSNGQGKRYFRKISVSQLKISPKLILNKRALNTNKRQSNNIIPHIHKLVTSEHGENYWFNGCAKYVMECKNESDYDYWFFSGITGDILTQIYSYDNFRGDSVTDYMLSDGNNGEFIEDIFSKCGYESTFITHRDIKKNQDLYVQSIIRYIDNGIPVILNSITMPGWAVFVGYEEYGETLLYITGDKDTPVKTTIKELFPDDISRNENDVYGLCFVGDKKENKDLKEIYREAILALPKILTTKTDGYCFGGEAYRAWATDIEKGSFDGMNPNEFDSWGMYIVYICNLATNSSCCYKFLNRAQKVNPDFTYLDEVKKQYKKIQQLWNNNNGEDLEALGGGFNITLKTLQDKKRCSKITAKIREMAEYIDEVTKILNII